MRLTESCHEEVKAQWEDRFERSYGRWRGFVDDVLFAFLDCGDLRRGFARVVCEACKDEYLLAFSCSRRGLCPSCAAKRGAIFGALLREEIVAPVGHCLWTFTLPKLLRPYFLHRRHLLGELCRAAWETVAELIAETTDAEVRPGMVAALHTSASDLRWHPHVHALASRGGWGRDGIWYPVPYVDTRSAELLFRHKVLSLLSAEGLLNADRIELLDSWKAGHTGFSAHHAVTVAAEDGEGIERIGRYLLRPPLSLERLQVESGVAFYRHKRATARRGEPFDPAELLARLLMHIPAPRLHLVRYYGAYSSIARARSQGAQDEAQALPAERPQRSCTAQRRQQRRAWTQMIRRIYEIDPLSCRCGGQMRIVSFILDQGVVNKLMRHIEKNTPRQERAPPLSALAS